MPIFVTVLLAACVLALFATGVSRWWFVGDDAYISFRYAHNLVEGRGLVWNEDIRVEGYTNFSLVMLVAAGMSLGLAPETVTHMVGLLSGLAVLGMVTWASARRRGWNDPWIFAAPVALVCTRSFDAWCTGGLETQLYAALLLAGLLATVHESEHTEAAPWRSGVLLSLAVLTRPDGALAVGLAALSHGYDALTARRSWASLIPFVLPVALLVGGHELFRIAYYGDWVPNTVHAKVDSAWVSQALDYLTLFHQDHGFGWYGWLALLPLLLRRERLDLLLSALVLGYLAVLLYIGGDRFDFRFLVFFFGPTFWLLAEGVDLLVRTRWQQVVAGLAWLALAAFLWTNTQRTTPPIRKQVESVSFIAGFAERRADQGRTLARLVSEGVLQPDTRLAVGAAGALPYFADLWALDFFGLNDPVIARAPPNNDKKIVAHMHTATADYMAEQRVHMFDASGWMVSSSLSRAKKAWRSTLSKLDRVDRPRTFLRAVCHRSDELYLVFATTLSEAEHAQRFGHLEVCEDFVDPRGGS